MIIRLPQWQNALILVLLLQTGLATNPNLRLNLNSGAPENKRILSLARIRMRRFCAERLITDWTQGASQSMKQSTGSNSQSSLIYLRRSRCVSFYIESILSSSIKGSERGSGDGGAGQSIYSADNREPINKKFLFQIHYIE